ncbi:phage tail tape measure protein [Escherichia coli]|nr:phage tail tape measure protein [Escherichia coli]
MGALALPVKSAITLESKMADVRKVVDGLDTPDAFKAMTEQVRALSTELAALGRPDATITRYDKSTFTCSSACTDAVNAPEWRYYWQINMPAATNTTWMTCGDPCDSALRIWGDTVVECVLNKLCPSHTYVIFKYPE